MFQKLSKCLVVSLTLIFCCSLLLISSSAAKNIKFVDQTHPKRCTTIIVGKDVTLDGSVLLAHNEELGDYSAHHYFVQPQKENDPDKTLESYYGAEILQVAKTNRYIGTKIFDSKKVVHLTSSLPYAADAARLSFIVIEYGY